MALFQRATNTQAFLKAGIMGFAGDGKTYTASELAIGLVLLMRQPQLPDPRNEPRHADRQDRYRNGHDLIHSETRSGWSRHPGADK